MEKSAVILGLSRQARFLGLPMPWFLACGGLTVMPFILFKGVAWLLTAPLWYAVARALTLANPELHRVLGVTLLKTPRVFLRKVRTYV